MLMEGGEGKNRGGTCLQGLCCCAASELVCIYTKVAIARGLKYHVVIPSSSTKTAALYQQLCKPTVPLTAARLLGLQFEEYSLLILTGGPLALHCSSAYLG